MPAPAGVAVSGPRRVTRAAPALGCHGRPRIDSGDGWDVLGVIGDTSRVLLSTDRLTIRRFHADDAAALAAYRSDPEVARYQVWETPFPLERAVTLVAALASGDPEEPGWFSYAIDLDGTLIGDIGVKLHRNRRQAKIGYTLAAAYQGKGYATEALTAFLGHLFTERGLHRVSAGCDVRNVRSARLLERLGFQSEGLRRRHIWIKGEWTDDLLYGLLASEWRACPSAGDEPA
ncbi:GNAT family protein [Sphaerisporangium sp. B11E5]|uniref:GNAT family N-acetyltransferase n=1 Tax=Sphaerisporangium sp. B11E5 TaxID=3153563 RepID=UPI00325F0277